MEGYLLVQLSSASSPFLLTPYVPHHVPDSAIPELCLTYRLRGFNTRRLLGSTLGPAPLTSQGGGSAARAGYKIGPEPELDLIWAAL